MRAIHLAPPEIVAAQIEAVLEDFAVAAIKIGMLGSAEIVGAVAQTACPLPLPTRDTRSRWREPGLRLGRRWTREAGG